MHDYASLKDKIDSSLYTLTEILKRNLLSDHPYFPFIIINADAQLPSNCNISSKFVYRFDYWHYEVVSFMKYIALVFVLCILLVTTPFDNLFYKNEPFMAHLGWMVVTQRISLPEE
ncbi:hypothetical protein SNEBB_010346 [Seison nebaliae]|nr:hypothetical protein SNEBB_010346 [Seison nebaliae]